MAIFCDECDRSFATRTALHQHLRDALAHAVTYDCDDCDRAFDTENALQQHLRDAPAHAVTYDCDDCDRAFDTENALQQHLRDAPAHIKERVTKSQIHSKWGGELNFMHSYGLKQYSHEDVVQADAVINALVQQMGGVVV